MMRWLNGNRLEEGTYGNAAQGTGWNLTYKVEVLDEGRSDRINYEHVWPSTAIDVETAAEQVNEAGSPKLPCVVTEFAKD